MVRNLCTKVEALLLGLGLAAHAVHICMLLDNSGSSELTILRREHCSVLHLRIDITLQQSDKEAKENGMKLQGGQLQPNF